MRRRRPELGGLLLGPAISFFRVISDLLACNFYSTYTSTIPHCDLHTPSILPLPDWYFVLQHIRAYDREKKEDKSPQCPELQVSTATPTRPKSRSRSTSTAANFLPLSRRPFGMRMIRRMGMERQSALIYFLPFLPACSPLRATHTYIYTNTHS